ncbi:hypothetical protein BDM02DRAFT_3126613 [Thelephora ganbajun]|uniref:Uncharacterized protein n=1 Tax=Thelephora ganbajun TaxID=370292 RepID=A0ACB6ZS74_THEGA|nr:hypothetical protein BDM02DRAFT_3126613 [Thelephora ganbajun]
MRSLVPLAALLSVVQGLLIPDLLGRASHDTCGAVTTQFPRGVGIIATNIVAIKAVGFFGKTTVTETLTEAVHKVGKRCDHPDNSLPQCSSSNPCGFSCTNGFTASGDDCKCKAPKKVCNGVCTDAVVCPSSVPDKRRAESLWQRRMSCDLGFTACGTTSSYRKTLGAYECADTSTDLESCGGCNIPLDANSPKGQDCSAIPGVASVSCYNGACRVHECMPGYTISADESTCHDENQLRIIKEIIGNPYKMAVDLT